jgi:MFS family permease
VIRKSGLKQLPFGQLFIALGMGIGPLVGGWLLDSFHWSSAFYINIPIIAVGIAGGYYFIQNSKTDNPRKLDIMGTLLSIGGIFALVFAIIQAGQDGWTAPQVIYTFIAAAVLLSVFIFWELRSKNAMLPLHYFKKHVFFRGYHSDDAGLLRYDGVHVFPGTVPPIRAGIHSP